MGFSVDIWKGVRTSGGALTALPLAPQIVKTLRTRPVRDRVYMLDRAGNRNVLVLP